MQAYGRGTAIGADQQRLIADAELWNFI
jgi:hypothetical protein